MSRRSPALSAVLCSIAVGVTAAGRQDPPHQDHSAHRDQAQQERPRYQRSLQSYQVPELTLIDQAGRPAELRSALESSKPVALNFIFTTCTTICPVMTATFSGMRKELGKAAEDLRLVSISIDPEYDTQAVLLAYAERYQAGDGWSFLTGAKSDVVRVLRAFDAYTGSKMSHRPLTFFKVPGGEKWLRIEGLARASDLAAEYRRLIRH